MSFYINKIKEIYTTGKLGVWVAYTDKLRQEHELNYLFWECTLRCNFFCQHCGSNAGECEYPDELTTQEIKNTFKSIADKSNPEKIMVAINGGEPLVRKDLFEVTEYINSLGFPWGLVTNGYLITENVVNKMKQTGLKSIVISIDGIGDVHDKFRGVQGSYDQTINAIKLLAKADFVKSLEIVTTVHKKNIHQLQLMYDTFSPLGIHTWRLINIDPIGRAEDNKELLLDDQEIKDLLVFIKDKRRKSKIKITYGCQGFLGLEFEGNVRDRFFHCPTGINIGSILHNGDIFVCPNVPRQKELIQGNIRKNDFMDVWNNKFEVFRDKNRTKCDKCEKCEYWDNCLGGSFHIWDFEKNEPKYCHFEILTKR